MSSPSELSESVEQPQPPAVAAPEQQLCSECRRPVGDDGIAVHKGGTWVIRAGGEKVYLGEVCKVCQWGYAGMNTPEAHRKARLTRARNLLTDDLEARTIAHIDDLQAPYFAALALAVNPSWSSATKLEFYEKQTAIAEKLYNRIEGLPVARNRQVDKEDNDIRREISEMPVASARKVVVDLLREALGVDDVDEDIVDAQIVPEAPGVDSAQPSEGGAL